MWNSHLSPVHPCRPIAGYLGGKKNLSHLVSSIVSAIPHVAYAEPFVGMGGVFFRRTMRPEAEIINDRSGDVATLFRILQEHYPQFLDVLKWQVSSRAEFERLMRQDPATLTDLRRAARFLYLQRSAFGGRVHRRSFGVSPSEPSSFDLTKLVPMLEAVHERLSGVTIECLDWADFLARYDRTGTLFYLDPPYYGCEDDYGVGQFPRSDFEKMAAALAGLRGAFLLSLNDRPEVREIFAAFKIRDVKVRYHVGAAGGKEFGEVLISNVDTVNLQMQESLFL